MDDKRVGRSPRARHRRTQARQDRVHPQKHRSPEAACLRQTSFPGIQEIACSARDQCPQRSVSSDPPANRAGIISRESNPTTRFYTTWVIRDRTGRSCLPIDVRFSPKATKLLRGREVSRRATNELNDGNPKWQTLS